MRSPTAPPRASRKPFFISRAHKYSREGGAGAGGGPAPPCLRPHLPAPCSPAPCHAPVRASPRIGRGHAALSSLPLSVSAALSRPGDSGHRRGHGQAGCDRRPDRRGRPRGVPQARGEWRAPQATASPCASLQLPLVPSSPPGQHALPPSPPRHNKELLHPQVYPSPLNYYKFPKSVCVSVNEVRVSTPVTEPARPFQWRAC